MSESPGEHLCAELISVAKICEANDVTSSDGVLNHDHCRDCPDLQTVAKEWRLLSINLRYWDDEDWENPRQVCQAGQLFKYSKLQFATAAALQLSTALQW